MTQAAAIKLSVGELVAFACRRGDLVSDAPAGPTAQEGIRAHQKLQKKRPAGSEAEYRLDVETVCEGQTILLSGRVDILHPQTDLHRPVQLDEIKTTYCPPDQLPPSTRDLHWAQLKLYGFCYLLQQQQQANQIPTATTRVALQLLWHNLKQRKTYPELREYTWPELEAFARDAIHTYVRWYQAWHKHRERVRATASTLQFPFSGYRPGQRELAVSAYRCLRDGGALVVEAPTGIGKTASTLFPAIKGLGENHLDQLVYLTAKNSGRQVVRETAARLHENGLTLSLLEIQARDKTCACKLGLCSPDADGICPRTQGFFDRLPEAREALLSEPLLTPEKIACVADARQLCPFELTLQMLPWVDLVVCDFNYVFDPLVRLNNLCGEGTRRALLVDEAHNLSDRARNMYSAELSRSASRQAAKASKTSPTLQRSIQSLVRALDQWVQARPPEKRISRPIDRDATETWVQPLNPAQDSGNPDEGPASVIAAAQKVMAVVSQLWEQSNPPPEEISEWLSGLYRFVTIAELLGTQHHSVTRWQHRDAPWQEQQLKLLCLNAGEYLQQSYRQFQGSILFSATLRPPGYVYSQLGLETEVPYLSLPSPFNPAHLGVFLCPHIDTRYRARDAATGALVELIAQVYHSRPGNYLVFFPSYRFLQQVAEQFAAQYPDIALVQQVAGANDEARAAFRACFTSNQQTLGFAIMGGIFGEGVDYVGEQLVGTIVVGVGLPQMNEEQELLRQQWDRTSATTRGNGFDIAYRYPGLTRVLQTAGRVIRTESDRGVVILADNRFADPFYRTLYPAHWHLTTCANGDVLSESLRAFWRRQHAEQNEHTNALLHEQQIQ